MTDSSSEEMLTVVARCRCPRTEGRSLPIRVYASAAELLRRCQLDPDLPLGTWWCKECKGIVVLTPRVLHWVA